MHRVQTSADNCSLPSCVTVLLTLLMSLCYTTVLRRVQTSADNWSLRLALMRITGNILLCSAHEPAYSTLLLRYIIRENNLPRRMRHMQTPPDN